MGYLTLSSRIAVLSLALLAMSACRDRNWSDPWPPEAPEVVLCPDDPRCGLTSTGSRDGLDTCRLIETRHVFKCGEKAPYLRCPGPGCPTGQPSIPSQRCWISETFIETRCPRPGPAPTPVPIPDPDPDPDMECPGDPRCPAAPTAE